MPFIEKLRNRFDAALRRDSTDDGTDQPINTRLSFTKRHDVRRKSTPAAFTTHTLTGAAPGRQTTSPLAADTQAKKGDDQPPLRKATSHELLNAEQARELLKLRAQAQLKEQQKQQLTNISS